MRTIDASDIDNLVYLDAAFISAKFEEKTGTSPPTQLTRVEGMKAGANVPFFSAGLHTQETRTYTVSSRQMLEKVADSLHTYPRFDPVQFENYRGTIVCWLIGRLTLGEWKVEGAERAIESFELLLDNHRISLLLNSAYLAAGFEAIAEMSEALKVNVGIPVRALARVMWYAERANTFVASPYIIYESAA